MEQDVFKERLALSDHLEDLRGALIRALLAVAVAFLVAYFFSDWIVRFLERPLLKALPGREQGLYFTGVADKFLVYLKVSFLSALALSSPYLLYEGWRFVSPGLYPRERRMGVFFVVGGSLSLLVGMAFGYWIVIPLGYRFLIEFGSPLDRPLITLAQYVDLTVKMLFALGLVFELPVVMVLGARLGIVNRAFLVRHRRHGILCIAVLSAVLTPSADALTMILVMAPLLMLFELSVWLVGALGARPVEPAESV